jgi:PHP family Zn ribbon phosphoesterase
MRFIADLHIHSLYSRATSKRSHIRSLAAWSQIKGVHLLGTGDFTHPLWFRELQETLEPAEPGFFRIKGSIDFDSFLSLPCASLSACVPPRFILSTEISSIYKRHGKIRKVHSLIFVPDFASAERVQSALAAIGNLATDGRPILRLDVHDLLEIVLEKAPEGFLVPAHIWTPWFSLFGSRSGFDSVEECFGDPGGSADRPDSFVRWV